MSKTEADRLLREQINRNMTNHRPDEKRIVAIEALRFEAKSLGQTIVDLCPPGRERSLAITHLEDAVMRAVQSIVTEGK